MLSSISLSVFRSHSHLKGEDIFGVSPISSGLLSECLVFFDEAKQFHIQGDGRS